MKKTALVTGGTAKDIPAIAALILNIAETNNSLVDNIIVFHDGISKKDQKLINKIIPVQFCVYKYHGNTNRFNDVVNKYFSTMIFCKYECFKLLNEYKTVIWTDYDVVLNNDISELLMPASSGFRMMPDIHNNVKSMFFPEINSEIINYNLNIPGICMPLFVLFDNMIKYNEYYEYCLKQTDKYAPYLYLPEQCVINLLLQDYNIDIEPIDFNIYCANPRLTTINNVTKIIHAYSQPKFWNGLYNSTWEKNYKKWLNMGGSNFKKSIKERIRLIIHPVIYQKLKSIYIKIKALLT
jgi:lipopolysaccharide biosynthesis glycosyltransferase